MNLKWHRYEVIGKGYLSEQTGTGEVIGKGCYQNRQTGTGHELIGKGYLSEQTGTGEVIGKGCYQNRQGQVMN